MDEIEFTEEEIAKELANLGYLNVPPSRLKEFKRGRFYMYNLMPCISYRTDVNTILSVAV